MESLNFTYTIEGDTYELPFSDLDNFQKTSIQFGILHGFSIGVGSIVVAFLVFISKQRKTPIFILNILSLVCMIIKSALYITYLMGKLGSFSFGFTNVSGSFLRKDAQLSIVGSSMSVPLILFIQSSFVLHIHAIFISPRLKLYRYMLMGFFGSLSLTTFALYVYGNVAYADKARSLYEIGYQPKVYPRWTYDLPFIMFALSVNLSSVVMFVKLYFAIKTRRCLGLKQFDSFHILFIMATQSMIAPSVLVIVQYNNLTKTDNIYVQISLILTVISLPLTTIWASSANNSSNPTSSSLYLSRQSTTNSTYTDSTKMTLNAVIEKSYSPNKESFNGIDYLGMPSDIRDLVYETNSLSSLDRNENSISIP